MSFIEDIESFDQELMLTLNGINAPWLDPLMVQFSNPWFWLPLHLLGLILAWRFWGIKVTLLSALFLVVSITLNDRISVELFKEVFERYRPCHNLIISPQLNVPDGCGGMYGFLSSHAANYFGCAMLFGMMFIRKSGWYLVLLLCWAGLIAYSRVYVGVHYPADITCGAILGIVIGYLVYRLMRFTFNKLKLKY